MESTEQQKGSTKYNFNKNKLTINLVVEIIVNNSNGENALRTLKRQGQIEDIFRSVKKNRDYRKPSDQKKIKEAQATQRRIRARKKT